MTWNPIKLMSNLIAELKAVAAELRTNTRAVIGLSALQHEANDLEAESNLLATYQNQLLEKLLARLSFVPDPGPITLLVISQEDGMLKFKIQLPAQPDDVSDIASGELNIVIGATEAQVIPTTLGQTEVADLQGANGDLVTASFTYINPTGVRSLHPSSIDHVPLTNTIPPPDPGALGIVVTAVEPDPAPVP